MFEYKKSILALSWNISTEPKLYGALALNPFSKDSLQIISARFPKEKPLDVISAVILAEPIGGHMQTDKFFEITSDLYEYFSQNEQRLGELSNDLVYGILLEKAFGTIQPFEVEQNFSQSQIICLKQLIFKLITSSRNLPMIYRLTPQQREVFSISVFFGLYTIFILFLANVFLMYQISHKQLQIKPTFASEVKITHQVFPSRLKIPSIEVDAAVELMGVTSDGVMDVPSNTIDVGWYEMGPSPGETGNAVISGHFDGRTGESGVFNNLKKLKPGDEILVENNFGISTVFVVRGSHNYDPGYADEVFVASDSGRHLNLITCNGLWDTTKKSYAKRLVVFADAL